jgi:hypothetical protein
MTNYFNRYSELREKNLAEREKALEERERKFKEKEQAQAGQQQEEHPKFDFNFTRLR